MITILQEREKITKILLTIFYIVGVIGIMVPFTSKYFLSLTPLTLLLTFSLLLLFHNNKFDIKTLSVFIVIYLVGFFIEMLGVQTGLIFGTYEYGSGLGPKIGGSPLIIGINWLMLTYASHSIVSKYKVDGIFKIFMGASLMLFYDVILETVAPFMDMWSFKNAPVPFQNYLVWFILALLFHGFFVFLKIDTTNKIAKTVFFIQLVFFLILCVFFKISI